MNIIESKNNSKIKDLIRLRDDSKFRNDKSLFYIEGERLFKDTPVSLIDEIYIKKDKTDYYKDLLVNFDSNKIYVLNTDIYDRVSDTVNSQGIIATVHYNLISNLDTNFLKNLNSCIILDGVSDPGNLGTIIRVAEASNIDLIILTNNCCNIYNTKLIRASMSSIFRNRIYIASDINMSINLLESAGYNLYATSLKDSKIKYTDIDYNKKFAIVFGNEANGVSDNVLNLIPNHVFIPMAGKIESLNVSISASIVLYESMRQKNFYEKR